MKPMENRDYDQMTPPGGHPVKLRTTNNVKHLGTLGSGNHFVEVCLDEEGFVWLMLHAGSRGVGNAIGTHFIELARQGRRKHMLNLPDQDLPCLDGKEVLVTRNPENCNSCSHGAGRTTSRTEAKRHFTVQDAKDSCPRPSRWCA